MDLLEKCELCPRKCGINRYKETGFCGLNEKIKVARAALHFSEEPCISGTSGSGTIFFSGCNLKCEFCQNYELSHQNFGREITAEQLGKLMLSLQAQGANNINLVTGVMYVPQIMQALDLVQDKLHIPVVYNSGGYENPEIIRMLKKYIDIYLVDVKYFDSEASGKYSKAADYFENVSKCIPEMIAQTGVPVFQDGKHFDDERALLQSGVIIRHLVMPGLRKDSMKILDFLHENFSPEQYILSLMSQYTPDYHAMEHKEINRRVMSFEYDTLVKLALKYGMNQAYIQSRESAVTDYTPAFDFTGLEEI